MTPAAALDELENVYLRDAVYFHHPRYLAHLNCPVVIPALLGEAVLSAVNSSMDTWDQSAGGTLIERRLIDWTAEPDRPRPGWPTASSPAAAPSPTCRPCCWPARRPAPVSAAPPPVSRRSCCGCASSPRRPVTSASRRRPSCSASAPDAVITVATDADRRMRTGALARELDRCRRPTAETVMAVVATAGTTDFGTIDPLPEIAELCAAVRRVAARRRRVRLRAARLADAAAPARRASSGPTR